MAAAGGGTAPPHPGPVWQDREIRFDSPFRDLVCRKGEATIDSINSVEDTKGNNGERGALQVTNLRLMWHSHRRPTTNLTIGFNCIQTITIRSAQSKMRGKAHALYLMTKFNGSRFEFVFTSLVKGSPRLFTTMQAVFRAYETSRLYRDLKLRGAVIRDQLLNVLPDERVTNKIEGVWNLSSDQGNLGTFYITNIRVVWHAKLAENFNVSIPYIQMSSIAIRRSRFGRALVITTTPRSGGYVLGFRVDPEAKLADVEREVTSMHRTYSEDPVLGVKFTVEEKASAVEEVTVPRQEDDVEIVGDGGDVLAAYLADSSKTADRAPVFNADLGLAVEALPEGFSVPRLWGSVAVV